MVICQTCNNDLIETSFYKDSRYSNGFKRDCKNCYCKNKKENREKQRISEIGRSLSELSRVRKKEGKIRDKKTVSDSENSISDMFQKYKDGSFSTIFIARSRSGKSTKLKQVIEGIHTYFDDIIFFTSSINQPIYEYFYKLPNLLPIHNYEDEDIHEKIISMIFEYQQSSKNNKVLLIFDDYINRKIKESKGITKTFIMGRNSGISIIYLSQYKNMLNKIWRDNANFIVLFRQPYEINMKNYEEFIKGKKIDSSLSNIERNVRLKKADKNMIINDRLNELMEGYKTIDIDMLE